MKTAINFKRYIKGNHLLKKEISFSTSGRKEWFLNGKRHREDGPAVEYSNGTKYWYLNGNRHREDGPAVEYSDGTKQWWLNGNRFLSEIDYWEALEKYKKNRKNTK